MKKAKKYNWLKDGKWFWILILTPVFFFPGCEDASEFNEPVSIDLFFRQGNNTTDNNYLVFNKTTIAVSTINFFGARVQGSDIIFDAPPPNNFGIYELTRQNPDVLIASFDIPQGEYNQMRWETSTIEINEDYYEDFFDEELEEYIDIDDYGVIFQGTYQNLQGTLIKIFIAIEPGDLLSFNTQGSQPEGQPVTVFGSSIYNTYLILNPYLATASISRSDLENAEIEDDDDLMYIEISPDENESIYERIVFRLISNLQSTIEEQ